LPLAGRRILITRSEKQAASFAQKLAQLGATPIVCPVIQFAALPTGPLDDALAQIALYDWLIFTSVNGVDFFFQRVDELGLSLSLPRVAVTGSATARRLQARRVAIDFMPDEFVGEALAAGLGDLTGQRVLLPRAKIGRLELVARLRQQGAVVDDVPLYDTVTAIPTPDALAELEKGVDIITFTSPSSVRNFLKMLQPPGGSEPPGGYAQIACIGPITAAEAEKHGLTPAIVPGEYTIDGLVQEIVNVKRET